MVERGVVQLGIVPVISASRRSRRLVVVTRCRPRARATIQINIFYISHEFSLIGRLHEPHHHSTPPCRVFTIVCRGEPYLDWISRMRVVSRFFFSPSSFSLFSNKNTFQLSSTLFLQAKKWNGRGKNLLSAGVNRCWLVVRRVSILGPLSCHF